MSIRPRNACWTAYIPAYDALAVLSLGEPLSDLRGLLLGSWKWEYGLIRFDDWPHFKQVGLENCPRINRKGTVVVRKAESDVFWKLCAAIGPRLEALSLEQAVSRNSIDTFRRSLINLRHLCIYVESTGSHIQELLRTCSGRLNSLHLDGRWLHKWVADAITGHCVGLETLSMRHIHSTPSLDAVWQTVGPTLRRLSLCSLAPLDVADARRRVDLTGGIAQFCDSLEVIELFSEHITLDSAFFELLKRIGPNLRLLSLPNRPPPDDYNIGEVVRLCPRAMFDANVHLHNCNVLETLGGRLRKMFVYTCFGMFPTLDWALERVRASGKMLTKLEQFEVVVDSELTKYFLSGLFMTPKPHLRKMVFRSEFNGFDCIMAEVFDALAKVVSTLEVVRFLDLNVVADDIERLVTANPELANVEVVFDEVVFNDNNFLPAQRALRERDEDEFKYDSEGEDKDGYVDVQAIMERENRRARYRAGRTTRAEQVAVEFVVVFRICTALKQMVISNRTLNSSPRSKRISASCSTFRGREVDIFCRGCTIYSVMTRRI